MTTFFIILGILIFLYLLFTFYLFRFAAKRQDKFPDMSDEKAMNKFAFGDALPLITAGAEYINSHITEEIRIKSHDGLSLYGYFVPAKNPKATMLLFHGYRSFPQFDFSTIAKVYNEMGFDVIAVAQRAHGKSEGKYIGFGVLERYDCVSWAEYAQSRFGKERPIALGGISMGASTVLMALCLDLPENVKCAIADCGFTSPYEIIKSVCKHSFHIPPFLIMWIEKLYFRLFAHYDMKEASTVDSLKKTKIPVLFLHGEADTFVPPYMTLENAKACASEHVLVTVPGAEHGKSYLVDKEKCGKALEQFLKKEMNMF